MASISHSEKGGDIPHIPSIPVKPSYFNPISPFTDAFDRFNQWRTDLGLPHPGTVENLHKEVKATHLTNYIFDGARADLTKSLSANPLFQVTHSFALGSQTIPSSYNFGAIFANQSIFLQGGVDHEGNVNARLNQGWSEKNITKVQAQFSSQASQNMIQLEHDYAGQDFSINAKAINPWPSDLTGIFVGSYLQSFTKNIALGFETLMQRPSPDMSELTTSYLAKFTGNDKNWIATAQIQPQGGVQATYWQKLSEKVEVAAELQLVASPARRDAMATLGAKYDLRLATFRAQVDSTGKVSALLEQRFTPAFAFLVSGEIDHFKNSAKVGVGVMIESSTLTPEEMGMPPQI
ncbi:hypothetical protein DXG01_015904 [Tephrocybe rancida]|nr:hypothetical protein DXG01_015904 [Tephrocybe rancida]